MDFHLAKEVYLRRLNCGSYVVARAFSFDTPHNKGIIPIGFTTDLCTKVPDSDWWLACVVHDFLYVQIRNSDCSMWNKWKMRRYADLDLAWLIQRTSDSPIRDVISAVYYVGVRAFGGMFLYLTGGGD